LKFDVYCDENRPDLLGSEKSDARYMVIGGLWLPADKRSRFKQAIHELRDNHMVGGEFKWQKISPSRKKFYTKLVDWFFDQGDCLRFRCIAVKHDKVNLIRYHECDQELGFYKFYYQMLHHWILDWNEYAIFCDYKTNRLADRLPVLKRCLQNSNLSSQVLNVQSIRSSESVLIQLADVLLGAVAARLNEILRTGSAKSHIVSHIESRIGRQINHTRQGEEKFNIFVINLEGGW
jgi:hypothetical protein